MRTVNVYDAKLTVTPDNSTPGSEGRLYLQFPAEMGLVGRKYQVAGSLSLDGSVLFTSSPFGKAITPKNQFWWKNGVRDHGIRENHKVRVWVLTEFLIVVELVNPTGEPAPKLPPRQDHIFK